MALLAEPRWWQQRESSARPEEQKVGVFGLSSCTLINRQWDFNTSHQLWAKDTDGSDVSCGAPATGSSHMPTTRDNSMSTEQNMYSTFSMEIRVGSLRFGASRHQSYKDRFEISLRLLRSFTKWRKLRNHECALPLKRIIIKEQQQWKADQRQNTMGILQFEQYDSRSIVLSELWWSVAKHADRHRIMCAIVRVRLRTTHTHLTFYRTFPVNPSLFVRNSASPVMTQRT